MGTTVKTHNIKPNAITQINIDAEFLARVKLVLQEYLNKLGTEKSMAYMLYIAGVFDAKMKDKPNPAEQKVIEEMEQNVDVHNIHTLYALIGFAEAGFQQQGDVVTSEQDVDLSPESAAYLQQIEAVRKQNTNATGENDYPFAKKNAD